MSNPRKKCEDITTKVVRKTLFELNLNQADLARMCGVVVKSMRLEFVRGFTSLRMRNRIEWALRRPFWSSIVDWETRLAMATHFGTDVIGLTLPALRRLAVKHGIRNWKPGGGYRSRKDLLAAFTESMRPSKQDQTP